MFGFFNREKPTGENEDHLILYHSNRICMIGIAKSHVALSKGVESISFDIGNCDRSKNEVKGKHKRGGLNLQPTTTLAILKCKDGSGEIMFFSLSCTQSLNFEFLEYKVASGIFGTLLETNDRLAGNLEKLSEEGYGYIAIAYTKPDKCDKVKSSLITEQDYNNSTSTESPADPKLEII